MMKITYTTIIGGMRHKANQQVPCIGDYLAESIVMLLLNLDGTDITISGKPHVFK